MGSRTRLELKDGVAWVDLDDGKVNALSSEMIGEIDARLDEADAAGAVVVLRGREGIFSAGFDLKTFAKGREPGIAMVRAGAQLILRLLEFPRPILTVCRGHAYPAGAFLMLSADVRYGIVGDWQIGMNEVAISMTVPRFAVELARHRLTPAGLGAVSTGRMLSPVEAVRVGYLDHAVAPEALGARVESEADRLRKLDWEAYAGTKARLNAPAIEAIRAAVGSELDEMYAS